MMEFFDPKPLTDGYFIPKVLLKDKLLSSHSKLVYVIVANSTDNRGQTSITQEGISEIAGIGIQPVKRAIKELIELGYVFIEKRDSFNHEPNKYKFIFNKIYESIKIDTLQSIKIDTLNKVYSIDTSKEVSSVLKNAPPRSRLIKQKPTIKRKALYNSKASELRAKKHTLVKKEIPDPKEYCCSPRIREILDLWESYNNPNHSNKTKTFRNAVSIIKSLLNGKDLKIAGFERFIGIKFSKSDFDYAFKLLKEAMSAKNVTATHTAKWIGKLGHVDGMLALNQTEDEKKLGVMRISWMIHRHEEFLETETCMLLQNLAFGQAHLDSYWGGD